MCHVTGYEADILERSSMQILTVPIIASSVTNFEIRIKTGFETGNLRNVRP